MLSNAYAYVSVIALTLMIIRRYSREVGSTQVTLEALPPAPQTSPPPTLRFDRVVNLSSLTSPREKTDLSERYQPGMCSLMLVIK